jgi:hypothetical protein
MGDRETWNGHKLHPTLKKQLLSTDSRQFIEVLVHTIKLNPLVIPLCLIA